MSNNLKILKGPIRFYGAGSSAAGPMYEDASIPYASYRLANSNIRVEFNFAITGSGAGKKQLETQKPEIPKNPDNPLISFAGSESLLTPSEKKQYPELVTFPIFAG